MEAYCPEKHEDDGELRYLVGTPWVNENGKLVNIYIGLTTKPNVLHCAANMWRHIKSALEKQKLKVVACGSAVNAA